MTALVAALVLALTAAPSVTTFLDPAGDSGTAPDITKTRLTSANGTYSFVFVFATPYGDNSDLQVYIDSDRKASTGDPRGYDYALGSAGLQVWDPAAQDFEPTGADASFGVAPGGRAAKATMNAADIDGSTAFGFLVETIDGDGGAGHADTQSGAWSKGLTIAASGQTQAKGAWTVSLTAVASGSGKVACRGAGLALARSSVVASSGRVTGVCVFKVPATLRHKELHATVSVALGGASATRQFTTTAK